MPVQPRTLAGLGLLATIPVGMYLLGIAGRPLATALSVACVLLVVATLYIVFGDETSTESEGPRSDGAGPDSRV